MKQTIPQDRELSFVQKHPQNKAGPKADVKTRNTGRNNNNSNVNNKLQSKNDAKKTRPTTDAAAKRNAVQKKKPKFECDNNGRRIRRTSPIAEIVNPKDTKPVVSPSNIIAQESGKFDLNYRII